MAGGYTDPSTGQYIPASFNEGLDLGEPQTVDQATARQEQEQLAGEKRKGKIQQRLGQKAQQAESRLEAQLKQKGLSDNQKRQIQKQLNYQKTLASQYERQYEVSQKTQARLQTKYYEDTGQYEKLLTGENRDAFAALESMFKSYGLGSLAGKIYQYAKQGYGADTISLLLQDTKEYKQRFAANEERAKAGLRVLSPNEYLGLEQTYHQILQDAGLPKGFYDSPTDFANWIARDASPTEIKGRVDMAVADTLQANPDTLSALQQLYGVDRNYITAYFLDDKRALPLLQKQQQAAQFGAEALKRGLQLEKTDLENWVTAGLSLGQVASGFQAVAEALPNVQAIAARYGEKPFSQSELEQDLVAGQAGNVGETRRKRLASQERALFGGQGGATPGGLSVGYQPS